MNAVQSLHYFHRFDMGVPARAQWQHVFPVFFSHQ